MTTIRRIQNNFTHGEFDPILSSRIDLDVYTKAAQTAKNVVPVPQGGLKQRPGMQHLVEIGTYTNFSEENLQLTVLEYLDEDHYIMMFVPERLYIFHIPGGLVQTITTTYTAAQVNELRFAQSDRTLVIVHKDHIPTELIRTTTAHNSWSLDTFSFDVYPTFDFDHNYDNLTFSLHRSASAGSAFTKSDNQVDREVWLRSSSGIFNTSYNGGLFYAFGGYIRFEEFISSNEMRGIIIERFDTAFEDALTFDPDNFGGTHVFLGTISFSSARGYPETVAFYQNRLFFGRTESLPSSVWASQLNGYYQGHLNFDEGTGEATDAINTIILSQKSATIKSLIGEKTFLVFTNDGIYASPLDLSSGLSPDNFGLTKQVNNQISENADPILMDNRVLYVEKGGHAVRSLAYDIQVGYQDSDISFFSAHLIKNPLDVALYNNRNYNYGVYAYFINEDGTAAVYQSVIDENISSWTNMTTDGEILRAASSDSEIYFIVKRLQWQGVPDYHLEKFNTETYLDSAIIQHFDPPQTNITGMGILKNRTVWIIADGWVYQNVEVDDDGTAVLPYPATDVQAGWKIDIEVQPMPLEVPIQTGSTIYYPKRIVNTFVDYYKSLYLEVNGIDIPYVDVEHMTESPIPKTGVYEIPLLTDDAYTLKPTITIRQTKPGPFFLRGLGYDVEV